MIWYDTCDDVGWSDMLSDMECYDKLYEMIYGVLWYYIWHAMIYGIWYCLIYDMIRHNILEYMT